MKKIKIKSFFRRNSGAAIVLSIIGDMGGAGKQIELPLPEDLLARKNFEKNLLILLERKFISAEVKQKKFVAKLSELGKIEYLKLKLKIIPPLSGSYFCLVVFDIPEKERTLRELLRRFLRQHGFVPWQKSVWSSDYDFVDPLNKIFRLIGLSKWVKVYKVLKNNL